MEDKKDFDTGMEDCSGDEYKKLVDKFLTIKKSPDKDKQKLHFEKMLEVFYDGEAGRNTDVLELPDEEIELVTAAGAACTNYKRCPICGLLLRDQSLKEHMDLRHKKK